MVGFFDYNRLLAEDLLKDFTLEELLGLGGVDEEETLTFLLSEGFLTSEVIDERSGTYLE